jgi:hypothetical protein
MHNEITDLLPYERRKALRRDYFLRLVTVVASFLTALTVSSAALLLPTYVFLTTSAHTKEARLSSIESTLSSSDEKALSARLTALSNDIATIVALGNAPSVSAVIRAMLAVSRPGITLSGFTYSSSANESSKTLSISGSSVTRDTLRNYQLALKSAPFAKSADLPISAYAKNTDIPFIITVTLAP